MMGFSELQIEALEAKLRARVVRTRTERGKTLSYVEGWRVISEANRIFGFDGWSRETVASDCVWQGPSDRIDEIGKILASFPQVSHAYERPSSDQWPYNLYTMVHGADAESVNATVKEMSRACGVDNYMQLETERELKKVPPTYIID